MIGVEDPEFVRSAVGWSCEIIGDELRISLTNFSGHRLPAEVPTRLLRVLLEIGSTEEEVIFRRPMKAAVGAKDNRLWPLETRLISRPLGGARHARVAIIYQQSMLAPPSQWISLGRWEMP
jgi:hypothetical protein